MENWNGQGSKLEGTAVAVLLDEDDYPANVGNVAAVSDQQIGYLRRDHHELINYRFERMAMDDCRAVSYAVKTVYYRIAIAVLSFAGAAGALYMILTGVTGAAPDASPLIVAIVAFLAFGARFIGSIHCHVLTFEMPTETLRWQSSPVDFAYKSRDAQAVRDFARERGILREAA